MGLTVDKKRAAERFREALKIARAGDQSTCIDSVAEYTQALDQATQKTFTPVYGSVLLAKATEPDIDALALQKKSGHRGYSAGSIGTVFFDGVMTAGIDARCTSPAFFNNQPFFGTEKIGRGFMPTCKDKAGLDLLVKALEEADFYGKDQALRALATYLRTREALTVAAPVAPLAPGQRNLNDTALLIEDFINLDSEGGRRGQALVLAVLSLVHPGRISTSKVNDPSRRIPGDVTVWTGAHDANGTVACVAEAKQKPVEAGTVIAFAEKVATEGIGAAAYAALAPGQAALDVESLILERFGVAVALFTTVHELLTAAIVWSGRPAAEFLSDFPEAMRRAFLAMDVRAQTLADWQTLAGVAFAERPAPG